MLFFSFQALNSAFGTNIHKNKQTHMSKKDGFQMYFIMIIEKSWCLAKALVL